MSVKLRLPVQITAEQGMNSSANLMLETVSSAQSRRADGRPSPCGHRYLFNPALIVSFFAWITVIGFGCFYTWQHSGTAAVVSEGERRWPATTLIQRSDDHFTLLLFAHPRCPCTRATLRELERLLAESTCQLDVNVLFLKPLGTGEDWAETDLWSHAAAIPGAKLLVDDGGAEATRFGASTSGEAFVYDTSGALRFQGGITPARGHEGDSGGHSAILQLVRGKKPVPRAPVFGCSLKNPPAPLAAAAGERT
jgi:hypothetical protein